MTIRKGTAPQRLIADRRPAVLSLHPGQKWLEQFITSRAQRHGIAAPGERAGRSVSHPSVGQGQMDLSTWSSIGDHGSVELELSDVGERRIDQHVGWFSECGLDLLDFEPIVLVEQTINSSADLKVDSFTRNGEADGYLEPPRLGSSTLDETVDPRTFCGARGRTSRD